MNPPPLLQIEAGRAILQGTWTLAELVPRLKDIESALKAAAAVSEWDMTQVVRLDSAGASRLWLAWGRRWPARLVADEGQRRILDRVAAIPEALPPPVTREPSPIVLLGHYTLKVLHNLAGLVALFGQLLLDISLLFQGRQAIPWREISAGIYKAGAQAVPVSALVGFLIGVTISYLSSLQLKTFGADVFLVNILGISIIRELGPVLVAVLVAGRSGSAITAQIGVMRVTEEIDALATMGISQSLRIILPKVLSLSLVMPLLVLWTSAIALLGGMVAAYLQLDLSVGYFIDNLPKAVPVANLAIGLAKGLVFGFFIALIACYLGLHVRPNTESLSSRTTASVVASITVVILVDAIFAILTRNLGMPNL